MFDKCRRFVQHWQPLNDEAMMSTPRKAAKTTTIGVRVAPAVSKKFHKASVAYGGASDVLRELILGFIEGRVKIAPPTPKREGSLYHVD